MLSDNPVVASPKTQLRPESPSLQSSQTLHHHVIPARALALRASTGGNQFVNPENGSSHISPRQQLERRAVTPNTSLSRPTQQQQQQYHYPSQSPGLSPLSEYHSGFTDEDLGLPCPSPTPYTGQTNHRRQQSFPNFLPLALRSRTPSPTRKTHTRFPSEQMPYTGDGRRNIAAARTESSRGGLSGWLSGTAAAASALGISLNNTTETRIQSNGTSTSSGSAFNASNNNSSNGSISGSNITSSSSSSLLISSSVNTTPDVTPTSNNNGTMTSRFMSAISSRFTTPSAQTASPSTTAAPRASPFDDEILNLNIESALFPSGSPADRDTFSPAAFKNFQMNAIGLLTKIQAAYKDRVIALHDLEQERSAQKDEMEEAETRAKHLKFQLEGMAAKAAEQERAMKQLMEELNAERKARQQLALMTSTAPSVISEDLGIDEIDRRGRKRKSGDSRSFDSDEEEDEIESAESESVFSISRCRSPTVTPAVQKEMQTPTTKAAGGSGGSLSTTPKQRITTTAAANGQMSAFQKIIKGISGGNAAAVEEVNGCLNCKGQDASVAWDTVGLLRDENRHLKSRVGELEGAVEGALDLVRGIGL
ncbi:hypothetical protein QBC38DRAFT_353282 [Podospora fimiseda]|uniref:Uncharacterized protein n=1 Tax=Podospora fimiseda TaxID=252190 RepID=A0AAN7H296_9PEZI|nr:hypothetical protein QBC38DRAFT_353282 [Podospora fimiseda]